MTHRQRLKARHLRKREEYARAFERRWGSISDVVRGCAQSTLPMWKWLVLYGIGRKDNSPERE